ncbi:MAG: hypothetical protein IJ038_07045 [Clostridia bacterium]|nr:hypothetical protein [Clostridia bacterium]
MKIKSSNLFQRIAMGVICVAVVAYTVFHMVSLFSAELSTIVVGSSTEETKLELDGYIFRDETLVYSNYGGAVDYIAYDGLKLAVGDGIAVVYEQGSNANVSDSIDRIDVMIERLENSTDKYLTLSDLPEINASVGNSYSEIMKKLADGDIRGISDDIDDMTEALGKVDYITDGASVLPSTLQSLREERTRLMAAGGSSQALSADRSGYFYSDIDGYEGIFTLAAADALTPDTYYKYASTDVSDIEIPSNAVGKMVYDSEWRFATMISKNEAGYFEEGEEYKTVFTGSGDVAMPLLLERITPDDDSSSTLLLFSCDRMPTGFDFARAQSIELVVESVTGISVPKSAVHKSNGVLYVYILKGSVVFERRIDVIYEGSDYYTVRDGVAADDEDIYLQSNDTLILSGQNLFDGRILE